jgi:hypothetical protein
MRTKKIVKHFDFAEINRNRLTFHAKVRLDPPTDRVILKETLAGGFPTDNDLYVRSWVANPESTRQWIGFQADVVLPQVEGVQVTSIKFRLGDGTNERYWNGTIWAAASTGNWNTEAEIANHISSFPITSRKLQIVANLKTTDSSVSPELIRVRVLYLSDIEFQEDYVYRLLVKQLRENVRPIADYAIKLSATGTTVDLDNYPLETPYNLVSIDAVFNHTDDPTHLVDLFSSYVPSTKVITLNTSVEAGKTLWVQFVYAPEVAVTTSSEYHEVAKTPAIVLEDVNLVRASEIFWDDSVINKDTGNGWKIPSPLRGDLEVQLLLMTDKGLDLHKMADEVKRFCYNHPLVRSPGLDEEYRLWLVDEFDMASLMKLGDVHTAKMNLRLVNVMFAIKDAVEVHAVKRFNLTGDMNATIEN